MNIGTYTEQVHHRESFMELLRNINLYQLELLTIFEYVQ